MNHPKKAGFSLLILALSLCLLTACGNRAGQAAAPDDTQSTEDAATDVLPEGAEAAVTAEERAEFARLVEANSIGNHLARHGKVRLEGLSYYEGGASAPFFLYTDGKIFVLSNEAVYSEFLTDDGRCFWSYPEDGYVSETLFEDDTEYAAYFMQEQGYMSMSISDSEVLTSFFHEDGQIIATTETRDESDLRMESEDETRFIYRDGLSMSYVYRFDEESYDLLTLEAVLHRDDGTELAMAEETMLYDDDVETYDLSASPVAAFLTSADVRTFTVTFASGTTEEHTVTYEVPKGCPAAVWYRGDYAVPYADPACTEEYEPDYEPYFNEDVTVYIKG